MADLEGKTIATTYRSILNVGTADNQELHASTPRLIEDGAGNDSALWLATTAVALGVDDTGADFRVYSATTGEGLFYDASQDEFGLLLTTKLKFHDIGGDEEIYASANGHLEINAGTTLDITAPTVDINTATELNIDTVLYDLNASGATTLNGVPVTIASTGDLTLDSSTDIILDAAGNDFIFKDGGTAQLKINNSTAGDIDITLMVNGDDLVFNQYDGTEVMRITDTARVGIGTNSPDSILHIRENADDTSVYLRIASNNDGTGDIAVLFQEITSIKGTCGYDGGNSTVCLVADTGTGSTKGINILSSGNVGIGTVSPDSILDITDSGAGSYGTATVIIQNTDNAELVGLGLYTNAGGGDEQKWDIVAIQSAGYFGIRDSTQGLTALTITENTGNLGIGGVASGKINAINYTLGDNEGVALTCKGSKTSGDAIIAQIGVRYDSGTGGGTKADQACAFITLESCDNAASYLWMDDGDKLRWSLTETNIGTTTGTLTDAQMSDERAKNISSSAFPYGLDTVNSLTPIKYKFKEGYGDATKDHIGFGAQTLQGVIPELINDTGECLDGYTREYSDDTIEHLPSKETPKSDQMNKLQIHYGNMTAVLVKAIQELSAKVTALENA